MQNANIYTEVNKNTEKYSNLQKFLEERSQLLEWGPEEVILDIGCGPGDVTVNVLQQWLPTDFRFLLGVDVSAKMIKHAQAVNANDKVEFKTVDIGGDVSEIIEDVRCYGGFDKVFSFYVLHWLLDLEQGISNIYSVMKPGGQALVTFPIDRFYQKTYRQARAKKQWSEYFKDVNRDLPPFPMTADPTAEFSKMLKTAGFEVKMCEVRNDHFDFDSIERVKALIEALDQDIDCIPSDLKAPYLDNCVEIMENLGALDVEKNSVLKIMLTCLFTKPKLG